MANLKFTEEELHNLHVFLQSVELKGSEVPAFLSIVNKVVEAIQGNGGNEEDNDD